MNQYSTLDQLVPIITRLEGDVLVALLPGNDSVSVCMPDHPEAWAESLPSVFRAPGAMNGETREFLRAEINARDGWAITGDEKKSSLDELMDFAVQGELELTPNESYQHKVWVLVQEHEPISSSRVAELMKANAKSVANRLSIDRKKGYYEAASGAGKSRTLYYYTAKEPPYESLRGTNVHGVSEWKGCRMILRLLDKGPLTSAQIVEATGFCRRRVVMSVLKLRKMGTVKKTDDSVPYHPVWELAEGEE